MKMKMNSISRNRTSPTTRNLIEMDDECSGKMNCSGILSVNWGPPIPQSEQPVLVIDCIGLTQTPPVVSWSGECGHDVFQENRHELIWTRASKSQACNTTTAPTGRVILCHLCDAFIIRFNSIAKITNMRCCQYDIYTVLSSWHLCDVSIKRFYNIAKITSMRWCKYRIFTKLPSCYFCGVAVTTLYRVTINAFMQCCHHYLYTVLT